MNISILFAGLLLTAGTALAQPTAAPGSTSDQSEHQSEQWKDRSVYAFELQTLDGQKANLADYQGKVALIVNVASKCGNTPQYASLQKLAEKYKDKGFVVLGFPCNDFGGQEPGTPSEIREFCTSNYKVTFPLFAKVSVKPGDGQSPLYKALAAKTGKVPSWNFGKYLVSRDGKTVLYFDPKARPESKEVTAAIEAALAVEAAPAKGA
ncbi:MAG: glutathione peroxidase [Phycisphaerales bacterium]|nr:glutathione peroxidase [Phycisphaerales bacterium]